MNCMFIKKQCDLPKLKYLDYNIDETSMKSRYLSGDKDFLKRIKILKEKDVRITKVFEEWNKIIKKDINIYYY